MKNLSLPILFCLFVSSSAKSEAVLDFSHVWREVRAHSPQLTEFDHRVKASEFEKRRAAFLWLPALSLEGRAFSTNDPATTFSSILGERSFAGPDFDINNLNHPGFNTFETLTLGLDLPLYDGGLRSSSARQAKKLGEAANYAQSYQLLAVYVETGSAYARVSSLIQAEKRLKSMSEKLNHLISHYSVGNKSNLVGYSGLLGIKSLINRIESVRNELQAESDSGISLLTLQGRLSSDWSPTLETTQNFLERIMPVSNSSESKESLSVRLARASAEAAESNSQAQKSLELPHLGLFASESVARGSRDAAGGLTGGLYLKWALFNPAQSGKVREADELQLVDAAKADQAQLESKIKQEKNLKKESALLKNLKLLEESESYLEEQTGAITKLFRNGSVTALQLAEVLNRGVDLVVQLKDLELGLIEHRSQRKLLEAGSSVPNE